MKEQDIKDNCKTGDSFSAKICGTVVTGKIYIGGSKNGSEKNKVFFCSDSSDAGGSKAEDTLGYEYSWVFDDRVKDIVITAAKKPNEIINDYLIY